MAQRELTVDTFDALVDAEGGLEARLRTRILPAIARYAAIEVTPLPRHRPGVGALTTLLRGDAATWVARMLAGRLAHEPGFPTVDAGPLLASTASQELAKLRCFLAYFDRIADAPPRGTMEIERIVGGAHDWLHDASALQPFEVHATGAIEDAAGCLQVDFANRFLGGGVLSGGCVQEEIRFALAPELLVAMIVSPVMEPSEAIVVRGTERFAATTGYGHTLRYAGAFIDPSTSDLVAIDALDYRRSGVVRGEAALRRELDKARAGFRHDARNQPVATGNWGCGVFLGDPVAKAIVQWLAASAEGRAVRYFTFGDDRLGDLGAFVTAARGFTVGELAQRLFVNASWRGISLYGMILA
jgi:poly(ADP-ribose) glycohydrolase